MLEIERIGYLKRRHFIKYVEVSVLILLITGHAVLFASDETLKKKTNPNIIIFFVDDLGYADVGYHGCKDIATPHIDSIATNGAQFTAAYVTAPVCGPSRAGLLTGRYQQRFGFEDNPGPFRQTSETKIGIPKTEKTLGERMKAIGYKTAFIGKHHSGKQPANNPANRGFDLFFGFDDGASNYFISNNPKKYLKRNLTPVDSESEYLTDAFGREAVSFIQENKDGPFLLYMPFNGVHDPLQAPKELMEKFKHIEDENRRTFAAMLYSVDENIGKVLQKLKAASLEEKTLVIFTSDNGGDEEKTNYSYNQPCRDKKGMVYDGGIRVPFAVQWTNTIPSGRKLDFPISTLDIMPTAIRAANVSVDESWELDGIDLLPYMTGEKQSPPDRYLYWRFLYGWAIRDNTWKLVKPKREKEPNRSGKPELYCISTDIGETQDLYDEYPEIAQKLQAAWNQWNSELIEAQWGWQPKYSGKHRVPLD